jgi:hypothetical protein
MSPEKVTIDSDFVARVRRHRPSSIVPLIARLASAYMDPQDWLDGKTGGLMAPWILAEITRVSLAMSNEFRKPATPRDLSECCQAYASLLDDDLSSPDGAALFFLRTAAEQLTYQHKPFNEMARTAALLSDTIPVKPLKTLTSGWDKRLLGCSISEYVGVGHLLYASCKPNQGRFDPAWLDQPQFASIDDSLHRDIIRSVLAQHYTSKAATFRVAGGQTSDIGPLRRFSFNPLWSKPAVQLDDQSTELTIPVPSVLSRKIGPLGIYHSGVKTWGSAFADDLGELFEQYVGSNLRLIPGGNVIPAIQYGKSRSESVDWIVVLPELVLLVEVKSVRPTEPVRVASENWEGELQRMLTRAFEQIDQTDDLIATGQQEFAAVPTDRPRLGLVVTMEDFHVVNNPMYRERYASSSTCRTILASAEDVEILVTMSDESIGSTLVREYVGQTGEVIPLKYRLMNHTFSKNTLLQSSWDSYPWASRHL